MFDRLSIRTKLIAMVAAPLALILVLATSGFLQRRSEASTTRADVRRLEAIEASLQLQSELELESLYSVGYLATDGVLHADDLGAQRDRTDEAAATFEGTLDALGDDAAVPAGRSAVRQITFLDSSLREQVSDGRLAWPAAEELYRQVEASLPPVDDRLVNGITDRDVAAGARSIVALGDYGATVARLGATLQGAFADGGLTAETRLGFLEAAGQADTELAIVGAQAGRDLRVRLRNQMAGGDISFFADQVEAVRGLPTDADLTVDAAQWSNATEATLDQIQEITGVEAAAVLDTAKDRVSSTEASARLFLGAALVAILLAVGLAIAVASSIARPLLGLARAADHVASEQLPQMVEALRNPAEDSVDHLRPELESLDVGGGKEMARLTASMNSIQKVAVEVASEQASLLRKGIGDMFVNLARRNQALLDRQLEFIDELEAQEEDPDQLESLFKLDHMATRMRRNAESLLVLAGAEPSRRRGKPVPLTKVALAAVGEIEHFARVDLLDVDECQVTSKAAADIAHLLSELMENATQFSPPETRVEVVGHSLKASGYTISITDQGIGMSASQLEEANEMLAHPPILGLTLARTLGFIVVGRLADRHGISVRLVPSPTGGVTAIVALPSAVLVTEASPGTLDLTAGSPPVRPTEAFDTGPAPTGPVAVPSPSTPSSILPPMEFTSYDDEAYDEDLAGDTPDEVEPEGAEPVPTASDRDLRPDPFGAPATLAEAVPAGPTFDEGLARITGPEPTSPGRDEVSEVTPLFTSRTDAPDLAPATPGGGLGGAPEPLPDGMRSPVARSTPDRPADGAPTRSPLPSRQPSGPRLFGSEPEPNRLAPSDGGTRLFSSPDRPDPTPSPAAPEATPAAGPEVTAAGLVKRVPRSAGAKRAVPGSDGGARGGATTSTRSPDEVRAMLSRFHTGRKAAHSPDSVDAPGAVPAHLEET